MTWHTLAMVAIVAAGVIILTTYYVLTYRMHKSN